jgi:hypothetical protein
MNPPPRWLKHVDDAYVKQWTSPSTDWVSG